MCTSDNKLDELEAFRTRLFSISIWTRRTKGEVSLFPKWSTAQQKDLWDVFTESYQLTEEISLLKQRLLILPKPNNATRVAPSEQGSEQLSSPEI